MSAPRTEPYGRDSRIRLPPLVMDGEALRLAVCAPAPVTRRPGAASGTRFAGEHSPRPPPLAPPAPTRIAPLRSSASQQLRRGLTSPARSSPATAPRLPDAIRRRTPAPDGQEISRFPREELEHMPGSKDHAG